MEEKQQEQCFVLETAGDGAECIVVSESNLKQSLHTAMCTCDEAWDKCETGGIQEIIKTLDDDDSWTHYYPSYEQFAWDYDVEDGAVHIVRLTKSPAVLSPRRKRGIDKEQVEK